MSVIVRNELLLAGHAELWEAFTFIIECRLLPVPLALPMTPVDLDGSVLTGQDGLLVFGHICDCDGPAHVCG